MKPAEYLQNKFEYLLLLPTLMLASLPPSSLPLTTLKHYSV